MSFSDSDTFSHAGEHKDFRRISRDRLLYEMLQTSKPGESKSSWKVLILDKLTVRVVSHLLKMSDITDQDVSLVEDIFRRRQPLPSMDAIYFLQPTLENVIMFMSDMAGKESLYKRAFVYFSSPVSKDLVQRIKRDTSVLPRIAALREMNLEYFTIDSQGYITDHGKALEELFGHGAEHSQEVNICLNVMAQRIATAFASLKEFPFVWYRTPRGLEDDTKITVRELVPTRLAAAVWDKVSAYKSSIRNFPQIETCDLLIVDRSVDQIAPIIHEWTYDAMCHDLLDLEGNKYVYEVPGKSDGETLRKEVLLDEHDPIWLQLRHTHIAEASERLYDKMTNFISKNKAAQLQQRGGSDISTRDMKKLIQALPQYNEQMEKLSAQVEIVEKINKIIRDEGLRDVGQLEEDLVFGDAGTKELINFLRLKPEVKSENKVRLLMIYAAVYPEKFEGDKALQLMQLAKLSDAEMSAVKNMKFIEGYNSKKDAPGTFSLMFSSGKRKHSARKERKGEEQTWALTRFYPMIEELIEKLSNRDLPKDEYSCMNPPSIPRGAALHVRSKSAHIGVPNHMAGRGLDEAPAPRSMRSRRTPSWAKSRSPSDGGYESDSILKSAISDFQTTGPRLFIFIIGGATRSELRVCHKLTTKLKREVILGATNMDNPHKYIEKLKTLAEKDISIEDIDI